MPFCAKCGRQCRLQYCYDCFKLHKQEKKEAVEVQQDSRFEVLEAEENDAKPSFVTVVQHAAEEKENRSSESEKTVTSKRSVSLLAPQRRAPTTPRDQQRTTPKGNGGQTCLNCGISCTRKYCSDCREARYQQQLDREVQIVELEARDSTHQCKTCDRMVPEDIVHCFQCRQAYKAANGTKWLRCQQCCQRHSLAAPCPATSLDMESEQPLSVATCEDCKTKPAKFNKRFCQECIDRFQKTVRTCKTCDAVTRGGHVYCEECVKAYKASKSF